MKKFFLLLAFAGMLTSSFAQQVRPSSPLSSEAYHKKAKTQRIIAISLLGSGAVIFYASTIRGVNNMFNEKHNAKPGLIAGLALIGASIPFIVAQHQNEKKSRAAKTSFIMEKMPATLTKVSGRSHFPALALRVSL